MIPEAMALWIASLHLTWNFYLMRPLYAHLYRTVLLGGGAYIISREALKAFHKRKVTHLKAIDIYKSQFPDRVPVKSYQTFGEIIEPWKPLR
ncbi:unnamed protein product [Schistosoma guineensis]|uniref:Uncharacterized protein n=1 Tax=Schistosoma mattheei TaxID=31246 RepID=A0AA85BAA0_9TREM|nr:unnamed protein product [Schistosoma mattheei]CAH8615427.1 unnamed protein product [Schistosoma intercalatum]CAH8628361.1 unnamed protein product [Schistosoma guineensis]CAH8632944.1 unnamed protein product [Schistosoma bovis]CAH8616365.1 unnamed protein product [Schistosoma intercalatum]